jgi:hypothetical protein
MDIAEIVNRMPDRASTRVLRFCLHDLGVSPESASEVLAEADRLMAAIVMLKRAGASRVEVTET